MRLNWSHRAWTTAPLAALVFLAACGSSNNGNTGSTTTNSAGTTSAVSTSAPAASAAASAPASTSATAVGSAATEAPRTAGMSGTIKNFVAALNKGDFSDVQEYLASDFTLTQANGQTVTGAGVKAALQGLSMPITIKSIAAQGGHKVDAMLQFGSGSAMKVEFMGSSTGASAAAQGKIHSMKLGQP